MKVILLKDIKGIGKRFEEKNVSDGHARNFLIPQKLVVPANTSSAAQVRTLKEEAEKSRQKAGEVLTESITKISGTTLEVKAKANEKGHLFEKLTAEKISEILKKEKEISIEPKCFELEAPIKEIGTFEVPILVGGGKRTAFTLEVVRA